MRYIIAIVAVFWILSLFGSNNVFGQENCTTPIVISDGSGGETRLDLALFDNDYETMCGLSNPGPDVVFKADASLVNLDFIITNEGEALVTLLIILTNCQDPDDDCNVISVPLAPGIPTVISGGIEKPIYVLVEGPSPSPVSVPLRFNYSLGSATPVKRSTWGTMKKIFIE